MWIAILTCTVMVSPFILISYQVYLDYKRDLDYIDAFMIPLDMEDMMMDDDEDSYGSPEMVQLWNDAEKKQRAFWKKWGNA